MAGYGDCDLCPFPGKGYAVLALKQLLDHAFYDCHVPRVHNEFEAARNEVPAWETHRKAGFKEPGVEDEIPHVMVTREDYLADDAEKAFPS